MDVQQSRPVSAFAIVSLALAILVPPLGLVLSIVALVSVNRSGMRGRGIATAGIIVGAALILLDVLGVVAWTVGMPS
jgi:hypothetical protein